MFSTISKRDGSMWITLEPFNIKYVLSTTAYHKSDVLITLTDGKIAMISRREQNWKKKHSFLSQVLLTLIECYLQKKAKDYVNLYLRISIEIESSEFSVHQNRFFALFKLIDCKKKNTESCFIYVDQYCRIRSNLNSSNYRPII